MASSTPPPAENSTSATNETLSSSMPPLNNSNTSILSCQQKSVYETIMSSSSSTSPNDQLSVQEAAAQNQLANQRYNYDQAMHRPISQTTSNSSPLSLQNLTKASLPYFQPWFCTAGPTTNLPPDFSWLSDSCGGKAAIGVFGGGVMGLLMGVFLGAMSDATPPVTVIAGKDVPQAPLREQVKVTMRATADKSIYWCRNFAFITGVFGGSECLVEKYRGTHDVWNSVASGCITGAALQAKQGPQAAALGCGGFAAFSLVIDSVMGTH